MAVTIWQRPSPYLTSQHPRPREGVQGSPKTTATLAWPPRPTAIVAHYCTRELTHGRDS